MLIVVVITMYPGQLLGEAEMDGKGTRCDQSYFLCTGAISAPGSALFGAGVGPIWLNNVQCNGTEERLEECGYNGWGNTPCYHSSDASVVCESKHS